MRTLLLLIATAAAFCWAQDDVLSKAMHDELERTMKQLQLENLEKPYFVAYRVVDTSETNVSASFGALRTSSQDRSRRFIVEVRVGDYKLDNTNFFAPPNYNSSMSQVFNGTTSLPIDDDYRELRRQMWIATDATYKKAVEDISRKRAVLQNKNSTDETPDFTKETPASTTVDAPPARADRSKMESLVRTLSALFRQMPGVNGSIVSLYSGNSSIRYLNSEGSSYTRRVPTATFQVRAATESADGTPINDSQWLYAKSLEDLPAADELASQVRAMGQRLTDLKSASTFENYNGPVLAEGDAAAQLFRFVFAPSLLGSHRVLTENDRQNQGENPFIDKIGARVLPSFLSVTDNPTLTEYKKFNLAGWSKVDEDGVPAREIKLVEKGYLKTLLVTRDPVRGIEHSTGSRHAGNASPTNLIVSTAEDEGLSAAGLRAKFLDLLKQRNKEFGIIVRRMSNGASPVLAYKVFLDGHEELIHGVQFAGLNAASFKEILAASKEQNFVTVDYYPQRGQGFPPVGDAQYATVTLAVPSLLFEDVTMRKARGETPKPHVLPHPFFDNKKGTE